MNHRWIVFISLSLVCTPSWARRPTFGAEFNFTNDELLKTGRAAGPRARVLDANSRMKDRFLERILEKCPDCGVFRSQVSSPKLSFPAYTRFYINHPGAWSVEIDLDPWVVEIKMSPMTTVQIREHLPEIQELIFESAHEIGLYSQDTAGHIHVGLESAFNNDPLLFRNFIVDWTIYSRMAFVLFGADALSGPTIDMLGRRRYNNFRKIIDLFDRELLNPSSVASTWRSMSRDLFLGAISSFVHHPHMTKFNFGDQSGRDKISLLAGKIIEFVYMESAWANIRDKYQSLNLLRISQMPQEEKTIEFRSVHEVGSAEEFLSLAEMIEGRLEYLKTREELIPFKKIIPIGSVQAAIDLFYRYSQEAGISWAKARTLLLRKYSHYGPTSSLLRCEGLLRDGWSEPVSESAEF